ncbi:MAG: RecX family transcriptional regulator, partial [Alphaproteobacteria bacterium]|nr:RecX family transcriptional regulator [Alphaproteobacteria bacterium]
MARSWTMSERTTRHGHKPATPELLEKAALAYLERFATSAAHLKRVLMRRVERSAQHHGTDRMAGAAVIDKLIDRYRRAGLLDDRSFAEGRVASLRRRGTSAQKIKSTLAAKGVDAAVVGQALEDHAEDAGRAGAADDLAAAIA